jgi:ADP-dependent NAD(P)H-hydrate dehydratase / NAD(P)H-hydrate epimerase
LYREVAMPNSHNIYRSTQIRSFERLADCDYRLNGNELMQRAGLAAFVQIQKRWPDIKSLIVFCGAGNNGGDGYVVAEKALQAGYRVVLYAIGDHTKLSPAAQNACQGFIAAGGIAEEYQGQSLLHAVVVDALLGIGLNRAPDQMFLTVINAVNASSCPVAAIDIPTGLHADTGCVLGLAVRADLTITFIAHKSGLCTADARDYCGDIVLEDLDLPLPLFDVEAAFARFAYFTPLSKRERTAHKGRFGHVLLIGGNRGFSGAIRMAAEACLRCGAGLVSVATHPEHAALLNQGRPEIMCHAVSDGTDLAALLNKASVVVIGPGLGQDDWAVKLFAAVLNCAQMVVVDADALNLLAKQPVNRAQWLFTPHPGEAARLLGKELRQINQDRYQAVLELQERFGGMWILKGAGSLIAGGGRIAVVREGNPGMAGGGMGDILCGVIAALLAQHVPLCVAAESAAVLHAQAADALAAHYGERGLLASDLYNELRYLINSRV